MPNRFQQVVGRKKFFVDDTGQGRTTHNDCRNAREAGVRSLRVADLMTVHLGHVEIKQYQTDRGVGSKQFQALVAAGGDGDIKACELQCSLKQLPNEVFVVDYQDTSGRGFRQSSGHGRAVGVQTAYRLLFSLSVASDSYRPSAAIRTSA
jgi:hypothetical protein